MDFSQAASHLNWLAVILAPFAGFVIGPLWYGPLFGKAWLRATGVTPEQVRASNKGKLYGTVFALNLIAALSLAMLIGPNSNWGSGLTAGLLAGLTFAGVALGVSYLFEFRSLSLFAINAGYQALMFAAMGTILGAWH